MDLRVLRYFVAVAEERHFRRAAQRLHMTQPPLSRAIRQLEDELGVLLLQRTPAGVALTVAGETLRVEAQALIEQSERLQARVTAAAGTPTLAVGTCADTAEQLGSALVTAFRGRHPHVDVALHETDLADPTAGLRAGLVDVALTRAPFDDTGIRTHLLRADPMAVVLREDDPFARRASVSVSVAELAHRRWIRLPEGTDPIWCAHFTGGTLRPDYADLPVMRTVQECLQSVLWSGTATLAPLHQALPRGLVAIPVTDRPPSRIVVAWKGAGVNPLVRAFVQIAVASMTPTGLPRLPHREAVPAASGRK